MYTAVERNCHNKTRQELVVKMNVMEVAVNLIFDSDDDDGAQGVRRPRVIRERKDYFADYDDIDFVKRFRLSKRCALLVLNLIDHQLEFPTFDKNNAVSPMNQLLVCLRFYATGCTQLTAGDFSGISEATAHRIIHRVSEAIATLYRDHIYFPRTQAELSRTQMEFHQIARFPHVIGAIDCTHIKIRSPGGDDAEYFRNRKSYFSINCQAICNANMEFMDLVARWPGSSHDQTVFDHCNRKVQFEEHQYADSVLLGDSAYHCREYMMTPLADPRTPAEILYNESQIRTRNPIERIFGIWKRRFPILGIGINTHVDRALPIIIACGVLFNILRRAGEPEPPDDNDVHLPMPWNQLVAYGQIHNNNIRQEANNTVNARQVLISDYFCTLHALH